MTEGIEILAPAGSQESLFAGVRCGADAVYLGGKQFNARGNAGNFDFTQLKEACDYCHVRGVKVYLTMNTLLSDSEMPQALECAVKSLRCGIDGIIVQDLGLAKLLHEQLPNLRLHGSTQLSVTSPAGFAVLEKAGFVRAVLPRELSLEEMRDVCSSVSMEAEAFVHGALCMCVSGQCYMSAMLGSRSGNRGLCAQPCRLPFYVDEPNRCGLSLKDMSLTGSMNDMKEAGINSFKIEGRMKRGEYVAAAVTACKEGIHGTVTQDIAFNLRSVFSRSGFTDGYLKGKLGAGMFGVRRKEDVVTAKDVLKDLAALYNNENPLVKVSFSVELFPGRPARIEAVCNIFGERIKAEAVSAANVQTALKRPVTNDEIEKQLKKTGGTPFEAVDLKISLGDDVFMPACEINEMRRNVLSGLEKAILKSTSPTDVNDISMPAKSAERICAAQVFRGRFDSADQIPESAKKLDAIILSIYESSDSLKKAAAEFNEIIVEMPRVIWCRDEEEKLAEKLSEIRNFGIKRCIAPNLTSVAIAKACAFTVIGDFSLNAFNSFSLSRLADFGIEEQTMSFEMTLSAIERLSSPMKRGIIGYGRLPLMVTRNCPVKNEKSCSSCGRKSALTDRKGISFPVMCRKGTAEILNSTPLYMADRLREIKNVDFITLYFTTETKSECDDVIAKYFTQSRPQGEFTRGLYYRGVL